MNTSGNWHRRTQLKIPGGGKTGATAGVGRVGNWKSHQFTFQPTGVKRMGIIKSYLVEKLKHAPS